MHCMTCMTAGVATATTLELGSPPKNQEVMYLDRKGQQHKHFMYTLEIDIAILPFYSPNDNV